MTPIWWAVAALLAPAPASVPGLGAPSLAAWHGMWSGEGQTFGKPATATLEIGPAPDAPATRLVYRLTIAGAIEGKPPVAYSAEANYRVDAKGRIRGNWTDSTGRTRAVSGRIEGVLWSTNWGSADVEIGRSTYRLETKDLLVVSDSVLQDDGSWRAFAVLRYRRNNG
ncbi:hypothetical protein [Sphingopyxis sp.]|uniref:hypothetical protein n=1 Tax=Sphingopyxis sp. TaxID=1908224 RepID=UPI002FC64B75